MIKQNEELIRNQLEYPAEYITSYEFSGSVISCKFKNIIYLPISFLKQLVLKYLVSRIRCAQLSFFVCFVVMTVQKMFQRFL